MQTPRRFGASLVVAACLALSLLLAVGASADRASLSVQLDKPGIKVSPTLYGIFFEEINHAGDGGLYAEMIRNRSFEDAPTPQGWTLVEDGGAEGSMAIDSSQPLNDKNRNSLRLEARRIGGGRIGVANTGYWGIPVADGKAYSLSFWARCNADRKGALEVSLESAAGRVYAQAQVSGLTGEWRRYACRLEAKGTAAAARLVIATRAPGTIWLDTVSLFPENTFKRRPNGLRADLAEMLAGIRPAFVRFPGGCFVEGDQLVNAFRWKDTIGDISRRPGHWNLWGYRSTDGLGYYKYLQMCEDLGAEPLFVINCGMGCSGSAPMDQMGEWVQDALDAIEYANGPLTSKWGNLRAKAGHPKPFGLKYMEIGNENGGPAYEERYALFYKAIKAKYPQMKLIANMPVTSAPMDIVDEHYYSSPDWFAGQAKRYDSYSRSGPKVYVGEYACTQDCGLGNLKAALGEAAFMTGMERNSDVVAMASYAPLFVNVNNRFWNPDAIGFDNTSCYGTPSYHMQKLFSRNRPTVILPSALTTDTTVSGPSGQIGLGTWLTEAEFKDIRVTKGDEALYAPDFATKAADWRPVHGDWAVKDGAYQQTSGVENCMAVAGDRNWTDYTYSLKARKLGGAEGFLIAFHVRDENTWVWWNLGGWGNKKHALEKSAGGKTTISDYVPGAIETGRWYDIRIELKGTRIRCYLDGALIHDVEDPTPSSMYAVAGRDERTGDTIIKVVNMSGGAQDTQVALTGGGEGVLCGTATVLTGSPDDENTLAQPGRVLPETMPWTARGPKFEYSFPPYSVTVLRFK
jgi:alpha-L-arabinofuranosidase